MRGYSMLGLLVSASLLPAAPALAFGGSDGALAVDPKDKMICKRSQKTGTRFYTQTCKTAAQWDALAEEHKRNLREVVDRPQIEIRK